jgi:hypothetical protein
MEGYEYVSSEKEERKETAFRATYMPTFFLVHLEKLTQ